MMKPTLKQASLPAAGFTLVELLVVIMIVGILAAIAAPTWQGVAASRRASVAQNEILRTLRQAQAEAIRTRRSQTVTFNWAALPPTVRVGNRAAIPLGQESTQSQRLSTVLGLQVSGSSDTPNNVVEFDSRGGVRRGVNMIITATSPADRGKRRCVIVQTLLGAMRTGQGNQCGPT